MMRDRNRTIHAMATASTGVRRLFCLSMLPMIVLAYLFIHAIR